MKRRTIREHILSAFHHFATVYSEELASVTGTANITLSACPDTKHVCRLPDHRSLRGLIS